MSNKAYNKWKMRWSRFWRGWIRDLVITLIVVSCFRSAIADWNDVPTGSMKPTILEGDRILVNKVAYDLKFPFTTWRLAHWSEPEHGDIVVFFSPADGKRLVKRVVGLPGDVVAMRNNELFVNGEPATYRPLDQDTIDEIASDQQPYHVFLSESLSSDTHPVMITPSRPSRRSFGPVTVPEGQYLMLGDNRDNSSDSRYFGFVERRRIVGRASAVVLSLKRDEYYLPRWHRFFHKLP